MKKFPKLGGGGGGGGGGRKGFNLKEMLAELYMAIE